MGGGRRHDAGKRNCVRAAVFKMRDQDSSPAYSRFQEPEIRLATLDPKTGIPAVVPAGSLVVFSSVTFHRSGANTTDRMRRAYVTQYSPEPIYKPGTDELMHLGVPFMKDGHIVTE